MYFFNPLKMQKIIPVALTVATVLFAGCMADQKSTQLCEENNGTWLEEFQECEYISRDVCEAAGGEFRECESACRNEESEDGAPIACTMQCVQVCKFDAAESEQKKTNNVLSVNTVRDLVVTEWGDCASNQCDDLAVNILDGVDGVWYVEALYSELRDDSVRDQKIITMVNFIDGDWVLGEEISKMQKCQPDRGHEDFSEELCL
jgi:hypothetical protein